MKHVEASKGALGWWGGQILCLEEQKEIPEDLLLHLQQHVVGRGLQRGAQVELKQPGLHLGVHEDVGPQSSKEVDFQMLSPRRNFRSFSIMLGIPAKMVFPMARSIA